MKQLFLITMSSLVLGVLAVTNYTNNLTNPQSSVNFTDSVETAAPAESGTLSTLTAADYNSPEAATKAFLLAWRRKNRAAMLKVAEKDVVNGIGSFIKGLTFRGCQVNTESARKAYNCTVQAGNDDLKAVYLEVVLTRIGYRIMSVDYAAH